jgi:RNA polymerase primary sigma factor
MDEKTDRVLATLPPREQIVLRLRFGVGDHRDHGLAEIGDRFGVSRERIRQLEAKALAMLRKSHADAGAGSNLRRGRSA